VDWTLNRAAFRHCRRHRRTGDSHADSSLGGGALVYTAATGANLGARAPLGAAAAVIEDRSNHDTVVGLSWIDSITEGEQNGVP
jgi:hypothetical protein